MADDVKNEDVKPIIEDSAKAAEILAASQAATKAEAVAEEAKEELKEVQEAAEEAVKEAKKEAKEADKAAKKAEKKAAAAEKKAEKKAAAAEKKADQKVAAAEKKADKKNEKELKRRAKRDEKIAAKNAAIDACPKEYKPVSTSLYFWFTVLSYVPVFGFVFTLITSILPKNKNVKNFERAILCFYIISIILMLIGLIVLFFIIPNDSKDDILAALEKVARAFSF